MKINNQFPILETERLLLCELTTNDAPQIYEYLSNPSVIKYLEGSTDSLEEAQGYVNWCRSTFEQKTDIRWGIVCKRSNQLIGDCGFGKINEPRIPTELGYMLAEDSWGHGYMGEALKCILDYGFVKLDLHRIQAWVHPENIASIRLLQKYGFQKEGHLREYIFQWHTGAYLSADFYALLRQDYEAL